MRLENKLCANYTYLHNAYFRIQVFRQVKAELDSAVFH